MKSYASGDVRNVCLVGAQGEGKTSIAEALLFNAGVTTRLGRVEEGNTVCDCSDDEIERRISINLGVAFYEHAAKKVNLLVAPGYADFVGEAHAGLAVAESAVFVVGADTLMTPSAENVWEHLEQVRIPTAVFVNKLDKENLDFESIRHQLRDRLGGQTVFVAVPDTTGGALRSAVNLLSGDVPAALASSRDKMIEDIAAVDDGLMEKYLDGKEIAPGELKEALKIAIRERRLIPVLAGSALKNAGMKELSDFIAEYLPAPAAAGNGGHFSALVFKTINEPGTGHLNFVKVLSGDLQAGRDIYDFTRQTRERVGQMCCVLGKKKIDIPSATAGDIAALLKLKDAHTNDVLGEEKAPPQVTPIVFPESIYERAVVTQSKGDDEKVGTAFSVITIENPTVKHYFNPETREMIVAGMGALQLEVVARRIKARYGVDLELRTPRVPYKETVHGKAEVQGKYKRQSGGRGQYGDCWLRIEPLPRGKGFEFADKIVGGAIPRNYIPAVEKGVKEAMDQGVIAGYPVVDMRVTVYDGSYHDVDSSDMAFKIAGAMALRKGVAEAKPAVLEPIMNLEVTVPEEYMGTIMGDLNSRRGKVLGMDKAGRREIIRAQSPLAELFQYATDLRSLTKGSGKFSMKLSHYEEAPFDVANALTDAYQRTRAQESEK